MKYGFDFLAVISDIPRCAGIYMVETIPAKTVQGHMEVVFYEK